MLAELEDICGIVGYKEMSTRIKHNFENIFYDQKSCYVIFD
jgi:hypothetical protein